MARGQRNADVKAEDKLEQALVPDSEQPYPVPENWCWVRFGCIAQDIADGPFGSNLKTEHYTQEREARIIQLSNIGEDGWREENTKYTTFNHVQTIARSIVSPGNIVIAKMMPAGRAIICPNNEKMYVLSSDAVKMVPIPHINIQYLRHGINSTFFQNQVQENTQGITRARTSIKKLREYAYPLPPLDEQRRIVDRIESLFAKLDEARDKVQEVVDGFKTRKAAILHKAFTGELTAQWRKEHGVEMESWEETTVGNCSNLITKGASPRWQGVTYTDDNTQTLFVTSENVREGYIDLSRRKYLDNRINEIQKRSVLNKGDVLVNIVGASIGRAAIFNFDCLANTNQAVCIVRTKAKLLNTFLCYYLNSPNALVYYDDNKVETARANISLTNISDMLLFLPLLDEQKEVVSVLDNLLEKEQQVKDAAESVLEQIGLIRKSILARAFRGELGTNDPTEECAVELLRTVL